jgi:uncharacterized membrane protein YgcG
MKKSLILLAILFFGGIKLKAFTDDSDSLGLPGDNLDLYGVLDLFKQSVSLEDFEKKLNDPANDVNNLDLNGDQNVDYIRVVDNVDGDAHAIALQVPVSATESQDVAVIEIQKTGTDAADLQVVGDEELYGENYIVQANDESASGTDQKWQGFRPMNVVVNVFVWPCVRFIYAPAYVVWVSPYRWMYYPGYWRPWHPVMWRVHYAHAHRYHTHYYVCVHEYRMERAHSYYHNRRVASPVVHQRYEANHQRRATAQGQRSGQNGTAQRNTPAPRDHASGHATGKTAAPRNGGNKGSGNKSGGNHANGGGQKRGGGGSGGQKRGGGGRH